MDGGEIGEREKIGERKEREEIRKANEFWVIRQRRRDRKEKGENE